MVTGIDVSHWQGDIEWDKVQETDHAFVFMKCTEAEAYTDIKFIRNWMGAEGKLRSPYHFWRYADGPATQARHFKSSFSTCGGEIELPPVLDAEDTRAPKLGDTPEKLYLCLRAVENEFGVRPIVYTGAWWWNAWIGDVDWAKDYILWTAHYTTGTAPRLPWGWYDWKFWQYTSKGSCPGIVGNVDMNRFNGSLDELQQLAGQEPPPVNGELEDRVKRLEELMAEHAAYHDGLDMWYDERPVT